MLKEIIKDNLVSELEELIRRNRVTFERTGNVYFKGKTEAYEVALGMIKEEIK